MVLFITPTSANWFYGSTGKRIRKSSIRHFSRFVFHFISSVGFNQDGKSKFRVYI